jgi:GT2 family glycosyltransferase
METQTDQPDGAAQISIVVPCYNNRDTIHDCLASIEHSVRACGAAADITVVDSSSDGTDDLIRSGFPAVRLIHLPERTLPGRARNLGARDATAPLLVFVDADCRVPRDWAADALRVFQRHPHTAAFCGRVCNGNPGPASWVAFISEFSGYFGRLRRRPMASLPTFCAGYRRDTFRRYGGFPEDLWPGEDIVLSRRMSAAGEPCFLDPSVSVYHRNRATFRRAFHHAHRIGAAFTRSRLQCPELPGASLVRATPLVLPLMGAWRLAAAFQRCLRAAPTLALLMLALAPCFAISAACWTAGAWAERRRGLS